MKNASGKAIRGLKVQAAYFDATEDLHLIPMAWNASQVIKNGDKKNLTWQNDFSNKGETKIGWLVVLQKVLFEDGTEWDYTSTSPSCYGEYWGARTPTADKAPDGRKVPDEWREQQSVRLRQVIIASQKNLSIPLQRKNRGTALLAERECSDETCSAESGIHTAVRIQAGNRERSANTST